jgi:hypothetical protein
MPVLCIPRVYPNISESRIRRIFDDLNMGTLDRIDIVSKHSHSEKGEKFNRVFIHFRQWNDTENANTARERLLNGKEIKIIYDDPWFWKISAYREPERKAPVNVSKAIIQFDSDDERPRHDDRRRDERPRYDDRRRDERPRPDDRRRDDRRRDERPRYDDRRRDEIPRHDDRRRDERPRYDDRRRDERPRHDDRRRDERPIPNDSRDERPRPNDSREERPRADSRETHQDVDDQKVEQVPLEYGNIMPPIKKNKSKEQKKAVKEEVEV